MSQSRPGQSDHHGELDPLLAFNAELAAAESPPKPVDPTPLPAPPEADDALPLRLRLDQAERSLERARIEISALKSDLVTLVTAVEDIKKRLGRRPEAVAAPHPVQARPRAGLLKSAAVVILCLVIGAAAKWSLASETMTDPPPVESESSPAPPVPEPSAAVPTPAVELQTVADVAPPLNSTRESPSAAQAKPVREPIARQPPRQGAYVGTLSIDAAPEGEVFINRQASGRTPLRAENLRAGSHLIWIERDGYRRWTRVVAVAADRVTRVTAELAPLSR